MDGNIKGWSEDATIIHDLTEVIKTLPELGYISEETGAKIRDVLDRARRMIAGYQSTTSTPNTPRKAYHALCALVDQLQGVCDVTITAESKVGAVQDAVDHRGLGDLSGDGASTKLEATVNLTAVFRGI